MHSAVPVPCGDENDFDHVSSRVNRVNLIRHTAGTIFSGRAYLQQGSLPLFERQDVRLSGVMRARPSPCGCADRLHHGQGLQQREVAEL